MRVRPAAVSQAGVDQGGYSNRCRQLWRCEQGRQFKLWRPGLARGKEWCKQGLVSAVAVATDTGDSGTSGSGLRQEGISEG